VLSKSISDMNSRIVFTNDHHGMLQHYVSVYADLFCVCAIQLCTWRDECTPPCCYKTFVCVFVFVCVCAALFCVCLNKLFTQRVKCTPPLCFMHYFPSFVRIQLPAYTYTCTHRIGQNHFATIPLDTIKTLYMIWWVPCQKYRNHATIDKQNT